MHLYVGTYTWTQSHGIYGVTLDANAGTFGPPELLAETPNPSFLALSPDGKRLYAACDPGSFDGKPGGGVAAFTADPVTHKLTPLGTPQKTGGGCCHVDLTPDGRAVLAADYGGATVALLPVAGDGTPGPLAVSDLHVGHGPDPKRQDKAHAHCCNADPTGRFALSCDLGTDEVFVYRIDTADGHASGLTRHTMVKVSPGGGPRHVAWSPDRRTVYVVHELGNAVDAFRWDGEAGTLTHVQQVPTLPPDFHAFSKAAEIAVHPGGAFVYASNRGHDSIAVFHVDRDTGTLSVAGHASTGGKGPRHFAVDPTGKFLVAANEESSNVVAFRIDAETGLPVATGGTAKVGRPVCVMFSPQ